MSETKEQETDVKAIDKLAKALNMAQAIMTGAKKDKKNPFFKSNYADLASVFDAIREPFSKNGLAIAQTMDVMASGRTSITTHLLHESGQKMVSTMLLPDIADPQKLGSAITYFRRYQLMAIAGIPAEDDDGNSSSQAVKKQAALASPAQVASMQTALAQVPDYGQTVLDRIESEYGKPELKLLPANLVGAVLNGAKEAKS